MPLYLVCKPGVAPGLLAALAGLCEPSLAHVPEHVPLAGMQLRGTGGPRDLVAELVVVLPARDTMSRAERLLSTAHHYGMLCLPRFFFDELPVDVPPGHRVYTITAED